jgi:hypothetical protein
MAKKKRARVKIELLKYIAENINQLNVSDRRTILSIIIADQGEKYVEECADGCRVIANKLSDSAVEQIIDIMNDYLE